jgi:hypothetical protein
VTLGPASNPALIDLELDARAISFENRTGARGGGGTAYGGRKGSPSQRLAAGERVVLADVEGSGVIRHIWMTFLPGPPEKMRSLVFEVFYDGGDEPSVSVPCLDFFGLPHGRPVAYHAALMSVNEGRGFNSYVPMPFRQGVRVELINTSDRPAIIYFQIDYTLQPVAADEGYLHVSFRRENPTVMCRDFVIAEGLAGPGRFLGCNVGVRVIDPARWYGEGEVKIYRDGDTDLPTICGTGLEDYAGSAWGMGAHSTLYSGAPLVIGAGVEPGVTPVGMPEFVGFYRWHLLDPVVYRDDLRVTIQQIGVMAFRQGHEAELEAYARTNPPAGQGWNYDVGPGQLARGLAERVDDYCATAYVYCAAPQPVARLDVTSALADIGRRDYEEPLPLERSGLI